MKTINVVLPVISVLGLTKVEKLIGRNIFSSAIG